MNSTHFDSLHQLKLIIKSSSTSISYSTAISYHMPSKHHSSTRLGQLGKRANSHTNLITGLTSLNLPGTERTYSQLQLSAGGSQSTLVLPTTKSKVSLAKKRSSHPARTNSSNSKPSISGHRKKSSGTLVTQKQTRKGAFKGALDADLDDQDDEDFEASVSPEPQPDHYHHHTQTTGKLPVEEEWVSEPSTRCATPTTTVPGSGSQPPLPASQPSTDHAATLEHVNLAFQLPNPLSPGFEHDLPLSAHRLPSPSPPQPPTHQHQSPQKPEPVQVEHPSASPSRPTSPVPADDDPEPVRRGRSRSRNQVQDSIERVQRLERSRASNENGSVGVLDGGRRRVVEPIWQPPPGSTTDEAQAQRSESPALSITSTATATAPTPDSKGKARATPISKRVHPHNTSIRSNRSIASLVNFHHDHCAKPGLKRVESSASVVLQPKVDPTEAFVTLKTKQNYSLTLAPIRDLTPGPTPRGVESQTSTDLSSSQADSSSSMVPPLEVTFQAPARTGTLTAEERTEFANRLKKLASPAPDPNTTAGLMTSLLSPRISFKSKRSTGAYFGTIKSFVGLSSTAEELEHQPHPPSSSTTTTPPEAPSTSQPTSEPPTSARASTLHFQLTNPTKAPTAKPAVRGLITTCGPTPVISRFLGPRPPQPAPAPTPTSIMGGRRIASSDTPSLPRIQQRLLMERDRPISPTGTDERGPLPAPSYLIRGLLGGQTGPLPFMPLTTEVGPVRGGELNEPAMRAKAAVGMRMWRSSLVDEVEQVWTDHESHSRWREPWLESLNRVMMERRGRRRRRQPQQQQPKATV